MKRGTLFYTVVAATHVLALWSASAAGVTIITHGLNGNVDDWVIPMAERIPQHPSFPGLQYSCYEIFFVPSGNGYRVTNAWIGGVAPMDSDSGEILIKLDWNQLANNDYSTYEVAEMVVPHLLQEGFVPDLNDHALAEWPLHLIGHSRGGSLVCEMSRLLGLQGVWVDQVTTLDPHPLNNDGFMDIIYTVVDATAVTYENVLFADNYFQNLDFFIYGKDVPGAYVRQLDPLGGGYGGLGGAHSDVHLWYHGTIDFASHITIDGATIGSSERDNWWEPLEARGTNAGFRLSRIGGGNRLSDAAPDPSRPARRIWNGMNRRWEFGAGTIDNRTSLEFNSGQWANLIELKIDTSAAVPLGTSLPIRYWFQLAQMPGESASLQLFLDQDRNPLNGNEIALAPMNLDATGSDNVALIQQEVAIPADLGTPGQYQFFGRVDFGDRHRWLYAGQAVDLVAPISASRLHVVGWSEEGFILRVDAEPGSSIVLQDSTDFTAWTSLATNLLTEPSWFYTNAVTSPARYYRALSE